MNPSTNAALDNPVWSALTTKQTHLRLGRGRALRYHPEIGPFAAVADVNESAFRELAGLLQPGEQVALQTLAPLPPLESVRAERVGVIRQMVAAGEPRREASDDVIRLNLADAADMLELAQKTKPGPFASRTHEMGHYIGIRDNGRLIAMAGERMHLEGYVEISAVCVDDAYRGKGLAGRLINLLRGEILQRAETPFLHVFDHNHAAVGLYERLGFDTRQTFFLDRIKRAEA